MTTEPVPRSTSRPITTLLVANRGEIARRVFATCRALGIGTVAVFSDADADAPFVAEADAAVRLPGTAAADTYLRGDLVVAAALRAGADAVHPGYGFLSENADLAAAVGAAGLVWVGPPPAAISAMGSKTAAKKAMEAVGVPVLADLDPGTVTAADLPVLVKASAGGGGRGMRVVRDLADLPGAVESAAAEALAAFGDGTVFVEPYVERGRHVEVQVLADTLGTVWALGERECSIQRRHQKIVEESPSPLVEAVPALRERLLDAATTAARAIGYVGAGTVEFLVDAAGTGPDGVPRFFFLETNTRLQVEHPVTELRHGLDLVAAQLAVAAGRTLDPHPPAPRGHAVEVRLYAEEPAAGWAPRTGTLHRFEVPGVDARFTVPDRPADRAVLRLDSGVESGAVVSPFYDPMLAKLIAWAPRREDAVARLAAALASARVHGVTTNRDLLVNTLRHSAFGAGDTDTGFLERHDVAVLAAPLAEPDAVRLSALAAALATAAGRRRAAPVLGGLPGGWRNVPAHPQTVAFEHAGERVDVAYRLGRGGLQAEAFDAVALVCAGPERVVLDVDGVRRTFDVAAHGSAPHGEGDAALVCVDSPLGPVALTPLARFPRTGATAAAGSLLAPMPGTVVRLGPAAGQRVEAGTPLVWLDAMKMEHVLAAPAAGVVAQVLVAVGDQVEVGAVLAVVSDDTPDDTADETADVTADNAAGAPAGSEEEQR
ncbi:biotin carboxylase N-terminal domain-containing protein [Kineosporia sp. R_H_3]|uniref:ATP-binding protein n=1 Tax=Kineosporia sp. R_H_3 TaxID=1961848 RepID=UPI000B4B53A1|nr:biotin carboxylase N-terminal domain-containing protein [Kineosporia sp. R_H_3]